MAIFWILSQGVLTHFSIHWNSPVQKWLFGAYRGFLQQMRTLENLLILIQICQMLQKAASQVSRNPPFSPSTNVYLCGTKVLLMGTNVLFAITNVCHLRTRLKCFPIITNALLCFAKQLVSNTNMHYLNVKVSHFHCCFFCRLWHLGGSTGGRPGMLQGQLATAQVYKGHGLCQGPPAFFVHQGSFDTATCPFQQPYWARKLGASEAGADIAEAVCRLLQRGVILAGCSQLGGEMGLEVKLCSNHMIY